MKPLYKLAYKKGLLETEKDIVYVLTSCLMHCLQSVF